MDDGVMKEYTSNLGRIRRQLISQGFSTEAAEQIVVTLVRGSTPSDAPPRERSGDSGTAPDPEEPGHTHGVCLCGPHTASCVRVNAVGRTMSSEAPKPMRHRGFRVPDGGAAREVTPVIARVRLDGVEHAESCPAQAKPLRLQRSASQWDGSLERTTSMFTCTECGLEVKATSSRDTRRRRAH